MKSSFHSVLWLSLLFFLHNTPIHGMLTPPKQEPIKRHKQALSTKEQLKIVGAIGVILIAAIALPSPTDNRYVCPLNPDTAVTCHSFEGTNCLHPYTNGEEISFTQIPCARKWIKLTDYKKQQNQPKNSKPPKSQLHKKQNR